MKSTKLGFAIIAAGILHGQAFADDDSNLVGKDWGCAVVMCMANPSGATAEPKCKPPIDKLHKELAKGHGFPECDGVKEHQVYDYYDPCPEGMAPAPAGSTVVTGVRTDGGTVTITSIAKKSEVRTADYLPPSDRACVGKPVGMMQAVGGQYEEGTMLLVYESATWQKPYPTPIAMDLFGSDGKFIQRVRIN